MCSIDGKASQSTAGVDWSQGCQLIHAVWILDPIHSIMDPIHSNVDYHQGAQPIHGNVDWILIVLLCGQPTIYLHSNPFEYMGKVWRGSKLGP
jgi:hypothetical protein